MDRNCLNCAHAKRKPGVDKILCYHKPGVLDQAFNPFLFEAASYVCENHATEEEWRQETLKVMKWEYIELKRKIREMEDKYPELKDMEETDI